MPATVLVTHSGLCPSTIIADFVHGKTELFSIFGSCSGGIYPAATLDIERKPIR